ncbi:MAG: hypothetical protein M1816_004940 [Peltula sp. TS41687]|nr:MAG: hypothetical protein M1816_004940 [Peltula sp. TS41687]
MDPAMTFPPGCLEQNSNQQLLTVVIVFAVLNTLFIALFFTARIMSKTAHGLDMYLMPFAYFFCFDVKINYGGAGKHIAAVSTRELSTGRKIALVQGVIYLFACGLPKLAILCLYLRAFAKLYCWASYVVAVVIVANIFAGIIMCLNNCKPIAYKWDKTIPGGSCNDLMAAYRWISLPNLITDVAMLVIPLPVIWSLRIKRNQKIGLTLTFLAGSFGIITSILRFVTFFRTDLVSDPTYLVNGIIWTCVEPSFYFVAATLPFLQPLARLIARKVRSSPISSRLVGSTGTKWPSRQDNGNISLPLAKKTSSATRTSTSYPGASTRAPKRNWDWVQEGLDIESGRGGGI